MHTVAQPLPFSNTMRLSVSILTCFILTITAVLAISPAPVSAATCPNLYRNLSFGSRGNDVVELQTFLIAEGDLAWGLNTGYFGNLTRAAVRKFQCREMQICSGSENTNGWGSVGPRTRTTIAAVCSGATQYSQANYQSTYYTQGSYGGTGTNFSASPTSGSAPLAVTFTTHEYGVIDFGDGTSGPLESGACTQSIPGTCYPSSARHTYLNPGLYAAILYVGTNSISDSCAKGPPCPQKRSVTITVTGSANASNVYLTRTPSPLSDSHYAAFESPLPLSESVNAYMIDFGDGITEKMIRLTACPDGGSCTKFAQMSRDHLYAASGTYTVKLLKYAYACPEDGSCPPPPPVWIEPTVINTVTVVIP